MSGNTTQRGRRSRYRHDDFHYFDQLPPSARRALADANFNWSSAAMLNRWKRGLRGYKTGKQIAERVMEWDRIAKGRSQP